MAKTTSEKKQYILSPEERETITVFNEKDPTVSVFTYNLKWKRKLVELYKQLPGQVEVRYPKNATLELMQQCAEDYTEYLDVILPLRKFVKLSGSVSKREYTEEQKKAASERMRKARAERLAKKETEG